MVNPVLQMPAVIDLNTKKAPESSSKMDPHRQLIALNDKLGCTISLLGGVSIQDLNDFGIAVVGRRLLRLNHAGVSHRIPDTVNQITIEKQLDPSGKPSGGLILRYTEPTSDPGKVQEVSISLRKNIYTPSEKFDRSLRALFSGSVNIGGSNESLEAIYDRSKRKYPGNNAQKVLSLRDNLSLRVAALYQSSVGTKTDTARFLRSPVGKQAISHAREVLSRVYNDEKSRGLKPGRKEILEASLKALSL